MFLLRHLKPERYGGAPAGRAPSDQAPELTVEATLQAMEPQPPAPPGELLGPGTLKHELQIADIADGTLPHFLTEQRPPKTAAREQAEARAAEDARGAEPWDKLQRREGELSRREFADMCHHIDPAAGAERSGKRYR
jgi:hypothetical protein